MNWNNICSPLIRDTFEGKIGKVEKDVTGFRNRMTDLENDMKKSMQAEIDEKNEIRNKIKTLEDEAGDQKRKHLGKVNSLRMEQSAKKLSKDNRLEWINGKTELKMT